MPSPVEIDGRMAEYDGNMRRWVYEDTGEPVPEAVEAKHFAGEEEAPAEKSK